VAQRTGNWIGPDSWSGPVGDDPDPTGGRHAFDRDAALTPIFTTLRRTARRSFPRPAPRDRWAGPDPVDRFGPDPRTAPIPVVRPLRPVPPAPIPDSSVPSPTETTTWWRSPVGFPPVRVAPGPAPLPYPATTYDAEYDDAPHDVAYDGAPYGGEPYVGPSYDTPAYDEGFYDEGFYDEGFYEPAPGRVPHGRAPYEPTPYEPAPYDRAGYGRGRFGGRFVDPNQYDPLTDTGRHHRRLAPAGW
jgi:hypothetical protein